MRAMLERDKRAILDGRNKQLTEQHKAMLHDWIANNQEAWIKLNELLDAIGGEFRVNTYDELGIKVGAHWLDRVTGWTHYAATVDRSDIFHAEQEGFNFSL